MRLVDWDLSYSQDLISIWNQELGNEFPMREELFQQNSFQDENVFREGSCVALSDQGEPVGFIVSKQWQEALDVQMERDVGWIQACVVKSHYQNQGIGTLLLKHAEEALFNSGINKILVGGDPWHYFPGVPAGCNQAHSWLTKHGYHSGEKEYDLLNEGEGHFPYPSQFPGVEFSVLEPHEKNELLEFLNHNFPGRWEYEAIHYFNRGGTGREFVVARKNNRIIGFTRVNDSHSPLIAQNVYWAPAFKQTLGGIGPLGVSKKERGNGYGFGIVQAGIYFLRQRGVQNLVIDWTGLVDFYKKFQFYPWKVYVTYKKERE